MRFPVCKCHSKHFVSMHDFSQAHFGICALLLFFPIFSPNTRTYFIGDCLFRSTSSCYLQNLELTTGFEPARAFAGGLQNRSYRPLRDVSINVSDSSERDYYTIMSVRFAFGISLPAVCSAISFVFRLVCWQQGVTVWANKP